MVLTCAGVTGCGDDPTTAGAKPRRTVTVTVPAPPSAPQVSTASEALPPAPAPAPVRPPPPAAPRVRVQVVGYSVNKQPLRVRIVGNPDASRRILLVGCIHGDESAGIAVTKRLRKLKPPAGTAWWIVDDFNPDGNAAGTRQNARNVDLNRNSPWSWQPLTGNEYSGTGPLSEPESRAINRFISRLRPDVSVWYHQAATLVDYGSGGDRELMRRYADRVGLPLKDFGTRPGSIATWQNRVLDPSATAFVVELPGGAMSGSAVSRHVAAVRKL